MTDWVWDACEGSDDEVEELRELNEAQTPTGVADAPELELEGGGRQRA